MDSDLKEGLEYCVEALEGKQDDRLFSRWVSEGHSQKQSFDEYKESLKGKQPMTDKEREEAKKRIDAHMVKLDKKFEGKAVNTREAI